MHRIIQKQTFKDKNMEATVWKYEFSGPEDRERMIEKVKISAQFDMRYRGLFQFYGDALIDYKQKIGTNKSGTEFLRVLAKYFTDNHEDTPLYSWNDCQSSFWEEFIFVYYPHLMKISKEEKQSRIFLSQLINFVKWLDQDIGTSCYPIIQTYLKDAASELYDCERLLNQLYLLDYPTIHQEDWNFEKEFTRGITELEQAKEVHNSIFQILKTHGRIIYVKDIDTKEDYKIMDMPSHLMKQGMLLDGFIAIHETDSYWRWNTTLGIFPERAKKYIKFVG